MSKKNAWLLVLSLLILSGCNIADNDGGESKVNIIPKVNSEIYLNKSYWLNVGNIPLKVENDTQQIIVESLFASIKNSVFKLGCEGGIKLETNNSMVPEAYILHINKQGVLIQASTNSGFFYAIQSLKHLLPNVVYKSEGSALKKIKLPYVTINDSPRFKWRGMMLDVSRHFFTVDEIKGLIDVLALLKINTFHWHLVDDQGWRIEIKKYPKLAQIGGFRVDQEHLHWNEREENDLNDIPTYGGFYTQDEIKEVIEYAASKYITVVPEIEGVAHVMSAIAAYPELSCKGKQIMVPSGGVWPITEIFCPGKESTFEFIENVLDEVIDLFPSKYIHIGGDEATKTNWKTCKYCQKRIFENTLNDVEELQSYMVKRIGKYIQSKGRVMIGWDEILEGGLADGAVVMSWRGMKGGLEAASIKHNVIMSPDTYVYLDHYQSHKSTEPVAIGGFSPLSHVYKFNPIPDIMPTADQKYVLGGQANVWTEYMPNISHLQYMVFPRMLAVSEALWTQVDNKDWDDFTFRVKKMNERFDAMGVMYSNSAYKIKSEMQISKSTLELELKLFTEISDTEIRYTIDDTEPDFNSAAYIKPICVKENMIIKALVYEDNKVIGDVFIDTITLHDNLAKGAIVSYKNRYAEKYDSGADFGLVDGILGSIEFDDQCWQGWFDENVELTLDMRAIKKVSSVEMRYLTDKQNQILCPENVKLYASVDGEEYVLIDQVKNSPTTGYVKKIIVNSVVLNDNIRYIKLEVQNSTNRRTGEKGWTFIDEIIVK